MNDPEACSPECRWSQLIRVAPLRLDRSGSVWSRPGLMLDVVVGFAGRDSGAAVLGGWLIAVRLCLPLTARRVSQIEDEGPRPPGAAERPPVYRRL
jgi:hypothetical protein